MSDENELAKDNEELIEDIAAFDPTDIVVYSRDWTIETIFSQIGNGNVDLNPKFQRRNAWDDTKRSKLIESILIGYPVPEIVLAEDPQKKRSFIVIDGKQRLLTIAGYVSPGDYAYWDKPILNNLKVKERLNKVDYATLRSEPELLSEYRQFLNSSLRCTIITNFKTNDILYDIFYRLNSGSVPLSTQELRQVLFRGEFANYLIVITNTLQPIHNVMRLSGSDKRLRDVEILLRFFSICLFGNRYNGNVKSFLDDSMAEITGEWESYVERIPSIYNDFNESIEKLAKVFEGYSNIGRKYTDGVLEKRFNRVLFEVQAFYFMHLDESLMNPDTIQLFREGFISLCEGNFEFRNSIESSTKTIENYRIRFAQFEYLVNTSFGSTITLNLFNHG